MRNTVFEAAPEDRSWWAIRMVLKNFLPPQKDSLIAMDRSKLQVEAS